MSDETHHHTTSLAHGCLLCLRSDVLQQVHIANRAQRDIFIFRKQVGQLHDKGQPQSDKKTSGDKLWFCATPKNIGLNHPQAQINHAFTTVTIIQHHLTVICGKTTVI